MVIGLKGELGHKTALEVIKNHNTKIIDFSLNENNETIKIGEKTINLVASKNHEMTIKETKPDIIVDFSSEFEIFFKDHLKLYAKNNVPFIVSTVFQDKSQLNLEKILEGSKSSVLVIDDVCRREVDYIAELTIHAIKFLFGNKGKSQIFEDDMVLDLQ